MNGRTRGVVGLLVALMAVSACATIPRAGTIHEVAGSGDTPQAAPFDFSPAGPRAGATPEEIVDGFLTAQLATPVTSFVARSFLTKESASSWAPDSGTIIYRDRQLIATGNRVKIIMTRPVRLDGQGRWRGASSQTAMSLDLVKEGGQWRISDPPNALIISDAHFEARFQQYSIYFFDPSGHVLTPEPVFLPWGAQAATRLVTALLMGPPPGTSLAERTYFPAAANLDISVPVIADGVADVPLIAAAGSLSGPALEHATAQIAWTLRQVPTVSRVRLTVGGQPLDLPGMEEGIDVNSWGIFGPSVTWASSELFGLRGSSVVQIQGSRVSAADLGTLPEGNRYVSVGLDLTADSAAVVDAQSRVYRLSGSSKAVEVIYQGDAVLRPVWDLRGYLWIYDRGDPHVVRIFDDQGGARAVPLPLPDRFVPDSVSLSRDGSRYVLGGPGGAWVVRVERTPSGRVTGFSEPSRILRTGAGASVTSLAWQTSTELVGVISPAADDELLVVFSVDGSTPRGETSAMSPGATSVTAAPDDSSGIFASSRNRLYERTPQGSWRLVNLGSPVTAATFVG